MEVILDNIKYVTKDGKEHYFEEFACEIPDGITDEEEISKEITKCIERYLEEESE